MFNPEFLTTDSNDGQAGNSLIQYLQEQTPDTLQRVANPPATTFRTSFATTFKGCWECSPVNTSR